MKTLRLLLWMTALNLPLSFAQGNRCEEILKLLPSFSINAIYRDFYETLEYPMAPYYQAVAAHQLSVQKQICPQPFLLSYMDEFANENLVQCRKACADHAPAYATWEIGARTSTVAAKMIQECQSLCRVQARSYQALFTGWSLHIAK